VQKKESKILPQLSENGELKMVELKVGDKVVRKDLDNGEFKVGMIGTIVRFDSSDNTYDVEIEKIEKKVFIRNGNNPSYLEKIYPISQLVMPPSEAEKPEELSQLVSDVINILNKIADKSKWESSKIPAIQSIMEKATELECHPQALQLLRLYSDGLIKGLGLG